ncbi:MAG: hypothetical protein US63_C0016G0003 [Candidatus Moranbacteria bacterium GW2011_GWC2_37_8]|nr:MAG: hypothetical protein US63_C0016G0003 [Candidatus Moranbacteria bacterium GW2011_GWC2_37_8]KKQ62484.1 MAG: hypothetical protein US82_C0010G0004 [Parcubacteria group bacterium GW2011_GWC1_38_22]
MSNEKKTPTPALMLWQTPRVVPEPKDSPAIKRARMELKEAHDERFERFRHIKVSNREEAEKARREGTPERKRQRIY